MSARRQVRKLDLPAAVTVDQQFWPIVVALCVLCAFSAGTVLTLLSGTWMWISLILLPVTFCVVVFALRRVSNRTIRRSLQLGLILSLAAHLLFVIIAHRTDLFHGLLAQPQQPVDVTRLPRVLQISLQTDNQPWEEVNEVPTPHPEEAQPVRQTRVDTAPVRPQPIPVPQPQQTPQPEITRRENPVQTVPRFAQNPSRLSRQSQQAQPRSSERVEVAQAVQAAAAAAQSQPTEAAVEATRADSPSALPTRSAQQPASSSQAVPRQLARSSRAERSLPQPAAAASSATRTASQRSPQADAMAQAPAPAADSNSRAGQLSAAETEVNRAPMPDPSAARREISAPSPRNSLAAQTPRNQRAQPAPSPSLPATTEQITARRSRSSAAIAVSPDSIESPRAARSQSNNPASQQAEPRSLAVSRAAQGVSGAGQSANVRSDIGSIQSPALTASDAARRPRATTSSTENTALSPREASELGRRAAQSLQPRSSLQAENLPAPRFSASATPDQFSASAGATISSAAAEAAMQPTAADRGTASADLGPAKVVFTQLTQRVEGGGQPELGSGQVQPQVQRSSQTGGQAPTLAADQRADTASAPWQPASRPARQDGPQPTAAADVLSHAGDDQPTSAGPRRADFTGPDGGPQSVVEIADLAQPRGAARQTGTGEPADDPAAQNSSSLSRRQSNRSLQTDTRVAQSSLSSSSGAGASGNAGDRDGLESQDVETARMAAGLPGLGIARATARALAGSAAAVPLVDSGRQRARSGEGTQGIEANPASPAPSPRTASPAPSTDTLAQARGTADATLQQRELADTDGQQLDAVPGAERAAPAGMALEIDAATGPAGLGDRYDPEPGLHSRRASRESPSVQPMSDTRFRRRNSGGTPAINPDAVIAKSAFRSRQPHNRARIDPQSEEAIELGLAFLARYQMADGSWSLNQFDLDHPDRPMMLNSDTAATGLALLAFQGAGYNHKEFKYAQQLDRAISWLIDNQQEDGNLYVESDSTSNASCRLYSHGIATLALTEAYGMTQDPRLLQPAQSALNYIDKTQDRRQGGWRYTPGRWSDTSVSGWMMMALQSGRLAGLEIDQEVWKGVDRWLETARDDQHEHLFRYNPFADANNPAQAHGRQPSPPMTAVGLLMRLYTGWNRDDLRLVAGADHLLEQLPADTTIRQRDTYYWYYATQVLRHMGGEHWATWDEALIPLLQRTQVRQGEMAGSWDPYHPVPDRWGRHGGRLYVTALNLLSLEVDYRLLPLYDDTVK